jgi:hypothetical protein
MKKKRLVRKASELNYPRPLRTGRELAPLPDIATYWIVTGIYGTRYWRFGRGMCFECEGMFTLGKNIKYRGASIEENLICDGCFGTKTKRKRQVRPTWRPRHKNS